VTWDYDPTEYQKQAAADERWHLERLIKYGIEKGKIKKELLKRCLDDLDRPHERRTLLEVLLWDKRL